MRSLLWIVACLPAACGCLETSVDALPVLDITARMQAECDEHKLTSMALVIRREGGELVELSVGELRGLGGARVDPFDVGWAEPPATSGGITTVGGNWCVRGSVWSYEGRSVPGVDPDRQPVQRLRDVAERDRFGLYRSHTGVTVWRCVSRDGSVQVVAATDTMPAPAPLRRVADAVLALVCDGTPIAAPDPLHAVDRERTRALVGRYAAEGGDVEILEVDGEPWLVPEHGVWMRLRAGTDPNELVVRDRLTEERRVKISEGAIVLDGVRYARVDAPVPSSPPEFAPLLGTYGDVEPPFVVLERHGKLRLLWIDLVETTLTPVDGRPETFETGRADEDPVSFRIDATGSVWLRFRSGSESSVGYRRRDAATGTFQIDPVHPEAELRRRAEAATPPPPPPDALPFDLVELRDVDPMIRYDIRYATDDNFLGFPVYERAFAQMQRPAAEALRRAHRRLSEQGYGILVHDAWRPWRVTKMFYDATPEDMRVFVADPAQGSRHNRGCAVDVALYEIDTGAVVEMPSLYDEFTPRAYPGWPGGTGRSRALRDLLRRAMEDEGFTVYDAEWWHFDYRDWRRYAVR